MKKVLVLLSVFFGFKSLNAQSQVKNGPTSKFEIKLVSKLGFAKFEQSGFETESGNVVGADFNLIYGFGNGLKLSAGIGFLEFNTNSFILDGQQIVPLKINNEYLRIPIQLSKDFVISSNESKGSSLVFNGGLGVYGNTLVDDDNLILVEENNSKGSNFNMGYSCQLGVIFNISPRFNFGIATETQGDLFKLEKNNSEHKLKEINSVNFSLGYKF